MGAVEIRECSPPGPPPNGRLQFDIGYGSHEPMQSLSNFPEGAREDQKDDIDLVGFPKEKHPPSLCLEAFSWVGQGRKLG